VFFLQPYFFVLAVAVVVAVATAHFCCCHFCAAMRIVVAAVWRCVAVGVNFVVVALVFCSTSSICVGLEFLLSESSELFQKPTSESQVCFWHIFLVIRNRNI